MKKRKLKIKLQCDCYDDGFTNVDMKTKGYVNEVMELLIVSLVSFASDYDFDIKGVIKNINKRYKEYVGVEENE